MAVFLGILEVFKDKVLENDFFARQVGDLILLSAASSLTRRKLNGIQKYFEQSIPTHSLEEFKAHFLMKSVTF